MKPIFHIWSFCTNFSIRPPFVWHHCLRKFPFVFQSIQSMVNHNPELRCDICNGVTLFELACYTWTALLSANQNRIMFMYIINCCNFCCTGSWLENLPVHLAPKLATLLTNYKFNIYRNNIHEKITRFWLAENSAVSP